MSPGDRIQDRYTLTEPLGSGGMAEVWRAHDERLERDVAIKFLRSHLATNPEFLVRFFSEAQSVARINHPNVVSILDFGRFGESPYLVMELVPGGALCELTGTVLAPERATEIVANAARGLGAAHELGIVHRDVKPGNILLDTDGTAKISDFGIASARAQETLTATGTAIGSPHYISNEHVSGDRPTSRSDVYSLGVVLYELLTGVKPFDGDNVTAIAIAHVDQVPAAPSTINPDIDPALDAVVLRCMSKEPEQRYENGAALAAELERLMFGAPDVVPEPPLPLQENGDLVGADVIESSIEGRRDRKTGILVAAIVVILLLAGGAAFVLGGGSEDTVATASVPSATPDGGDGKASKSRPSIEAAPAGIETSPSPTPEPSPTGATDQTDADEESDDRPSNVFSGGTTPEPEEEPTEEPTEEPSPQPTAEPTPEGDSSPDAATDDGGTSEG